MKVIEPQDLFARAKKLYFDKNENIKEVFATQYGSFSYQRRPLIEKCRAKKINVYQITRDMVKNANTDKVELLSDRTKKEAEAKKAEAPKVEKKSTVIEKK